MWIGDDNKIWGAATCYTTFASHLLYSLSEPCLSLKAVCEIWKQIDVTHWKGITWQTGISIQIFIQAKVVNLNKMVNFHQKPFWRVTIMISVNRCCVSLFDSPWHVWGKIARKESQILYQASDKHSHIVAILSADVSKFSIFCREWNEGKLVIANSIFTIRLCCQE